MEGQEMKRLTSPSPSGVEGQEMKRLTSPPPSGAVSVSISPEGSPSSRSVTIELLSDSSSVQTASQISKPTSAERAPEDLERASSSKESQRPLLSRRQDERRRQEDAIELDVLGPGQVDVEDERVVTSQSATRLRRLWRLLSQCCNSLTSFVPFRKSRQRGDDSGKVPPVGEPSAALVLAPLPSTEGNMSFFRRVWMRCVDFFYSTSSLYEPESPPYNPFKVTEGDVVKLVLADEKDHERVFIFGPTCTYGPSEIKDIALDYVLRPEVGIFYTAYVNVGTQRPSEDARSFMFGGPGDRGSIRPTIGEAAFADFGTLLARNLRHERFGGMAWPFLNITEVLRIEGTILPDIESESTRIWIENDPHWEFRVSNEDLVRRMRWEIIVTEERRFKLKDSTVSYFIRGESKFLQRKESFMSKENRHTPRVMIVRDHYVCPRTRETMTSLPDELEKDGSGFPIVVLEWTPLERDQDGVYDFRPRRGVTNLPEVTFQIGDGQTQKRSLVPQPNYPEDML